MLPTDSMMRWLKAEGAERLLTLPDGSLIAYRRSHFSQNTKREYWAMLSVAKIGGGYVRAGDAWLLCDAPPLDAKETEWQS